MAQLRPLAAPWHPPQSLPQFVFFLSTQRQTDRLRQHCCVAPRGLQPPGPPGELNFNGQPMTFDDARLQFDDHE